MKRIRYSFAVILMLTLTQMLAGCRLDDPTLAVTETSPTDDAKTPTSQAIDPTPRSSVSASALGVDANTLPPSLSFQPGYTPTGEEVLIAWQAGYPLTSFDPQDRPRLDLAGVWRKERVKLDSTLTLAGRGAQGLAALEAEAASRFEIAYDDSEWLDKELPNVENVMTPTGPESYEGGVWYRRTVVVPANWEGQRVTLNALAINYVADVWVNGQWVGYHEGGFTPFALDIAPTLKYGQENTIAIRVDNPAWGSRNDIVPGLTPDWWNYTGIVQDFYLEAAPPVWVVRADVRTPDTSGNVLADIVLHNAGQLAQAGELTLQIYGTDRQAPGWLTNPQSHAILSVPEGDSATFAINIEPGQALVLPDVSLNIPFPQLWSPENPALYVLQASVRAEESSDNFFTQFGVRTVETSGHQWHLNGDPYFMAGIARHEEWPDSGRTAKWDKILKDLQMIQALNANFVRTAHYPNHPHTYLLTDRLGLLVAEEIPVWQYGAAEFAAQSERRIADQMWREMILAGSNRPSIILWSMHNESQAIPERSAYVSRLTADYKQHMQDGRLLMQSAAADRGGPDDTTQGGLDVAGWTMYFGIFYGEDYGPDSEQFLAQAHAAFPRTPILVTEYGIWSKGGGSSTFRQVDVFAALFPIFRENAAWNADGGINPDGFLGGITWWAMFDWYTAHTREQTMGLYEMDREKAKPIVDVLRDAYLVWGDSSP